MINIVHKPTPSSPFGEQSHLSPIDAGSLPYIRYNAANKQRAAENRKPMTKAERKMRFGILRERPGGYKFIRQKMINFFILDFYCAKLLLGIEIDGSSHDHRQMYDKRRSEKIGKSGIKIIRYKNEDVFYHLDSVSQDLAKKMKARENELAEPLLLL